MRNTRKRRIFSLLLCCLMLVGLLPSGQFAYAEGGEGVEINATNFPDKNFREFVKQYDKDSNGYLKAEELAAVTKMDCHYKNIAELTGIEHFTALTELNCSENQLTSLDVSKNTALKLLNCAHNQLTLLDVSKNTALTKLSCYVNQLTSLDVSKNTALTELWCGKNQINSLDVSKNTALTELNCYVNQLNSLDVSKNTALTGLICYNNKLNSLDISAVPVIKDVVKNGTLDNSNSDYDKHYISNEQVLYIDKTVTIITDIAYTVTFDANGHGTAPAAQSIEDGKTATKPTDPIASGWKFRG